MPFYKRKSTGFTLIEILIVVAIGGMLMLSLGNVVGQAMDSRNNTHTSNDLDQEAVFVMQRIIQVVSRASLVNEVINTADEIHYEFRPDPERDIDKDGIADSDNDGDGLVDEDDTGDMNGDGQPGIAGVDDDGDGDTDEGGNPNNDDEDDRIDEDKPEILHLRWKNGFFIQREWLPFDLNGDSNVDDQDKLDTIISDRITTFTVTTPAQTGRYALFDVTLVLTDATGNSTSLSTSIRIGGRL